MTGPGRWRHPEPRAPVAVRRTKRRSRSRSVSAGCRNRTHRVPDGQQVPGLRRGGRPGRVPEPRSSLPQQLRGRRSDRPPPPAAAPRCRRAGRVPPAGTAARAAGRWAPGPAAAHRRSAGRDASSLADLDQGQRVAPAVSPTIRSTTARASAAARPWWPAARRRPARPAPDTARPGRPSSQARCGGGLADREDHGDGVRVQPAGHERERVGRFTVQPLGVVHQAEQRLAGRPGRPAGRGRPGRPGTGPEPGLSRRPKASSSAVRWGGGEHTATVSRYGRNSWCSAPKLNSISDSMPSTRMTARSAAAAWPRSPAATSCPRPARPAARGCRSVPPARQPESDPAGRAHRRDPAAS